MKKKKTSIKYQKIICSENYNNHLSCKINIYHFQNKTMKSLSSIDNRKAKLNFQKTEMEISSINGSI